MDHTFLNWIYWNPNPDIFTLPFLDKPVRWYGFLFVTGIMISYLIVKKLYEYNPLLSEILALTQIEKIG